MTDLRLVDLETRLASYEPSDDREVGYLNSMLTLLASGGGSLSRHHFDPGHFTASGFVVSPDRSSLLLVHHVKLDKWLQPGGHVERSDADLENAARREVLEETGLRDMEMIGLLDVDVHRCPARGEDPHHDHFDVRFGYWAGSVEVAAGEGTSKVVWFPLDEVVAWKDRPSMSRPAKKLLVLRS
jgi:8-oxo-dGTP pyrophosphatase MutT (NUDIX family)